MEIAIANALSEAPWGCWHLLQAPSAGSLENAPTWPASMLQTELASGRVFHAGKLAFPMSSPFSSVLWSPQSDPQGFFDQSHGRKIRRPREVTGMVLSQGDQFDKLLSPCPPPKTHTHGVFLIPQGKTGNFTHVIIVFPKNMDNLPKYHCFTSPNLHELEGCRRDGL